MISVETPFMAAESTTIANPVWSQIMIVISAYVFTGGCCTHAIGSPPAVVQSALSSPYCGWAGGRHA